MNKCREHLAGAMTGDSTFVKIRVPLSPLLGRDEEFKLARELLLSPEVRLITIKGPGGVGKTQLAMTIAQSLQEAFADRACWVALATINDPERVISTISEALGEKEVAAKSQLTTLCTFLRDKEVLMVLDNCEHLLSATPLLAELLEQCSGLTLLVTSRVVLRIRGEHVLPISPLPLPDPTWNLAEFSSNPAVALFSTQARALDPRFWLTETNAPVIAEICRRLDGLPLAIELAAAHIQLLSPQQMLSRLSQRLDMFKEGRRDLPDRQSTLRSSIQWSYDLLSEDVQRLFRRLCFFTGDCSLAAITSFCQILGDDPLSIERGVGILLDHSLLQQSESENGDRQFVFLETVRDFGLEELASSDELERVRADNEKYVTHLRSTPEEVQLYIFEQTNLEHQPPQQPGTDASSFPQRSSPTPDTGTKTIQLTSASSKYPSSKYPSGLTEREVQVLRLIVQGLTNKQIAKELVLSPRTINVYVTSIYNKLGVNSRSAATRIACTRLFD
jgi:predicted ATPase/DNA-binding CsgD family transcriptional regulator